MRHGDATHAGGMTNYEPYSPSPAPSAEPPAPGSFAPGPFAPGPFSSARRPLVRRRDDRMIAGVCSGVGDHLGIDANLVRILLVVGVVFGFGTGIVLYALGWWLIPQA